MFNPTNILNALRNEAYSYETKINKKLDLIIERLTKMATSFENLTAAVQKNSDDIDAALAAIENSKTAPTPAQLDALTAAISAKDVLIEQALQTPVPPAGTKVTG